MSDTETKIEIEDVLASIRRLVSRDAGAVQTRSIPHRSAVPESDPEQDVECLVLTPAHRVAETEAPPAPEEEDFAATSAFAEMNPEMETGQEEVLPHDGFAGHDRPDAGTEPVDAVALAVVEAAETGAVWLAETETAAPDAHATDPAAIDDVTGSEEEALAAPSPYADSDDDLPAPTMPRVPTEAEALLAEAEAALAETGAVLEDATATLGAALESVAESGQRPLDIVDELARLESTIAELEAAVAESGADLEPGQEHPVAADMGGPGEWPQDFTASEPADAEATCAPALAGTDLPDPDLADPDLAEAAWTEPAPTGMDWAEATLRLAERGPRRFTREEAELAMPQPDPVQSSYAALREELAHEDMLEGAAQPNIPETLLDDAMIDEATLREIVGQMVRAELRGALGERITQNVRKLVRREIQRALMGQDFD